MKCIDILTTKMFKLFIFLNTYNHFLHRNIDESFQVFYRYTSDGNKLLVGRLIFCTFLIAIKRIQFNSYIYIFKSRPLTNRYQLYENEHITSHKEINYNKICTQ